VLCDVDDVFEGEAEEEGKREYIDKQDDQDVDYQEVSNKTIYIRDITNNFAEEIYKSVDLIHQNYLEKIVNLNNNIVSKDKKINVLDNKLNNEIKLHTKTKEELSDLKLKFENIKSLFR
jgi:hypothetical protein